MLTAVEVEELLVAAVENGDAEAMLRQVPPEEWPIIEAAGGRVHTTVTRDERPVSRTYFANREVLLKLRDTIGSKDGDRPHKRPVVTPATTPETEVQPSPGRDHRQTGTGAGTTSATDKPADAATGDRSPEGASVVTHEDRAPTPDFDHGQNLVIEEISRAAGMLMEHQVLPLGDTVPADPDQAHDRCQELVWKLHRAGCLVGIYAGQVFSIIEERELWKGRAESFVDYLRSDEFNPLGYDTARRLQRVHRFFCEERSLSPAQIHAVEVKKLDAIASHDSRLRKHAGEALSGEQVLELVDEARELTRADFQARLREIRGEEALKVGTIEKMLLMYQSLDGQSRMELKRGMQWVDSGKKRFEKETGWVDVD